MAKITITTTVRVEVDTEKWAREYSCTEQEAEADALKYVPELLVAGLERQKSWMGRELARRGCASGTRVSRREPAREQEGAGEDSAAPARVARPPMGAGAAWRRAYREQQPE